MKFKREQYLIKKSHFFHILAFLSALLFAAPVFAAGYTCPEYIQYSSCNAGYYMTLAGSYDGTPTAGNACTACPTGCTCAGGTNDKVCSVTITLDSNGGTGTAATTDHCEGNSCECPNGLECKLPATGLTKANHAMGGWNSNAAGTGTDYGNAATFTAAATIYVKWTSCQACDATNASCSISIVNNVCTYTTSCDTGYGTIQNDGKYNASCSANTYDITFNPNGGTGGSSTVTATYGAGMPSATMPTRTDYNFGGYYDQETDGTQYYTATGASARIWDKAANTTLYAHWGTQEITCAEINVINGESQVVDEIVIAPEKCKYNITCNDGYHAAENGEKTLQDFEGTEYTCTANTYSVVFTANGGSDQATKAGCTYGTQCDWTNTTKQSGLSFKGWAVTDGGAATITTFMPATFTQPPIPAHNATITLYAVWGQCDNRANALDWDPNNECVITKCENGYKLTGTGTGTKCELCNESDAGYYCPGGPRLPCKAGYYCPGSNVQNPCPFGKTSPGGSSDEGACYIKGGSGGTKFCDASESCFYLPVDVHR